MKQPTYPGDLPDFDLAPEIEFDPSVFGNAPIDGFVLSLALAFNDLKTFLWLGTQLERGQRKDWSAAVAYNGQHGGMKIHLTRMVTSILHEIIKAIREQRDVWEASDEFNHALKTADSTVQRDWELLVADSAAEREDEFQIFLATVRNALGYHYYQPKKLLQGYRTYFNSESEATSQAFVSISDKIAETRFFFADAAAQGGIYSAFGAREIPGSQLRAYINRVGRVLNSLIGEFLISRLQRKAAERDNSQAGQPG